MLRLNGSTLRVSSFALIVSFVTACATPTGSTSEAGFCQIYEPTYDRGKLLAERRAGIDALIAGSPQLQTIDPIWIDGYLASGLVVGELAILHPMTRAEIDDNNVAHFTECKQ